MEAPTEMYGYSFESQERFVIRHMKAVKLFCEFNPAVIV